MRNIIVLLVFLVVSIYANDFKNLGTYGNIYDINETNGMTFIQKKIDDLNQTMVKDYIKNSVDRAFIANSNVRECVSNQTKIKDLTVTLGHDIDLKKYGVFVKSGTTFNPLDYASLSKKIYFINGDKPGHLKLIDENNESTFIVTDGNIKNIMKTYSYGGVEIYKADKASIDYFQIDCVPTVITQFDKKSVKIESIKVGF